jgi:type I restriction enzyme, S subunit
VANAPLRTDKEPLGIEDARAGYQSSAVRSRMVPPGYKLTDVGVFPEEWDADYLGDNTTKVGSGITPTVGVKVYRQEGRPFLRSQNIGWGTLLLDDIAFIDDATHKTFKATEIEADDVFLNITGASIGRSAIADARVERGNVNQHVCIIRADQDHLHPRFLNYLLLSDVAQRQIDSFQAGGNRQGLNFGQIRSFRLPIPPVSEQRAIAAALSDVDALLAKLDQLIAKKRDLKQAGMQQLLAGKARLPGFSAEWEMTRLGDAAEVVMGQSPPGTSYNRAGHGAPLINGPTEFTDKYPIKIQWTSAPTKFCKKGDLLLCVRGSSTGRINISDDDYCIGRGIAAVRGKNANDTSFLTYQAYSAIQRILAATTGSTFPNIDRKSISAIEIPLPPVNEQTAIVAILSDMDAEIAALEARRDKTRALKQGMMQELLTGRIRLV